MNLNPYRYIIKRYYSKDLTPSEFKLMNFWLPFFFNRIKIVYVSNDFKKVDVLLKHTFWNRNPNKSLWGGAIFSAVDPFYPIILKQILLQHNIETIFLMADINNQVISSSLVKEIAQLGGNMTKFTTKSTIKALKRKLS